MIVNDNMIQNWIDLIDKIGQTTPSHELGSLKAYLMEQEDESIVIPNKENGIITTSSPEEEIRLDIYLDFSETWGSSLCGVEQGILTFENQIKEWIPIISKVGIVCLCFPEEIQNISISFLNGLFDPIKSEIGIKKIRKKFLIDGNFHVVDKIYNYLDLKE